MEQETEIPRLSKEEILKILDEPLNDDVEIDEFDEYMKEFLELFEEIKSVFPLETHSEFLLEAVNFFYNQQLNDY